MSRFFTTLLAGVAIGLLVAPEKGSVIRTRIAGFWDDLKDELRIGLHTAEGRIETAAGRVDSVLQEQVS